MWVESGCLKEGRLNPAVAPVHEILLHELNIEYVLSHASVLVGERHSCISIYFFNIGCDLKTRCCEAGQSSFVAREQKSQLTGAWTSCNCWSAYIVRH